MGGTAWWLGEALQESHRAVKIATGVAGLAVAWVSLRHVERRLPAA
jgi:hypothetical protein